VSSFLQLGRFLQGLDPLTAGLTVAVVIIGGYNGWDFFNKKKDQKKVTQLLMIAWTRLFDLATHKTKIYYHDIFADQMRIVDTNLDEAMHTFQDIFYDLKKDKGTLEHSTLMRSKDIKVYFLILKVIREVVRTDIRALMRENHLMEKSEIELQSYIEQQFEIIARRFTEKMNELFEDDDVRRDILYTENNKHRKEFFMNFSTIVRGCRDVAIRYDGEVKQIDKQVQSLIQNGDIGGCIENFGNSA